MGVTHVHYHHTRYQIDTPMRAYVPTISLYGRYIPKHLDRFGHQDLAMPPKEAGEWFESLCRRPPIYELPRKLQHATGQHFLILLELQHRSWTRCRLKISTRLL